MGPISGWLDTAPTWQVGILVIAVMVAAAAIGVWLRASRERHRDEPPKEGQEGYIVSAVFGLMALLLGFTFSLAIDRFDTRRSLVLQEANAIGTTYLRTQLLPEPHRARISGLLVAYTDNRIVLGNAPPSEVRPLLARNDALINDLWSATASAFGSIKSLDFSSAYLDSMNNLIDLDAARKVARVVRVPSAVFVVLVFYLVMTAGVLGYVLVGARGRIMAAFTLFLLSLALLLVIDIDRPTTGRVRESQMPMEALRASLLAHPPADFDRHVIEDARAGAPAAPAPAPK